MARMTSDHLTPAQRAGAGIFLGEHVSWGSVWRFRRRAPASSPLPTGVAAATGQG